MQAKDIGPIYGEGLSLLRNIGKKLCPEFTDWNKLNENSELPPGVVLSALLISHLANYRVLSPFEAASAVEYFKDRITRYADDVVAAIKAQELVQSVKGSSSIRVSALEVLAGRVVRFGLDEMGFDVKEQRTVQQKLILDEVPLWSHVVMPLGLLLNVYRKKPQDAGEQVTKTEAAKSS